MPGDPAADLTAAAQVAKCVGGTAARNVRPYPDIALSDEEPRENARIPA